PGGSAGFAASVSVLLEATAHEANVVHDGRDAWQAVRAQQPDIAILDIGMPRMNGDESARRVRKESEGQPVLVALTGWGQASDREAAVRAGFDHHLVKPVAPEALLALVGAHCASGSG